MKSPPKREIPGVALIQMDEKKIVFLAYAGGNTHSAALLPDGNVVSVSSTGNFLALFRRNPESTDLLAGNHLEIHYEFQDPHGCVWDESGQVLWILGLNSIASYEYLPDPSHPALRRKNVFYPPEHLFSQKTNSEHPYAMYGHDLYPIPHSPLFF